MSNVTDFLLHMPLQTETAHLLSTHDRPSRDMLLEPFYLTHRKLLLYNLTSGQADPVRETQSDISRQFKTQ